MPPEIVWVAFISDVQDGDTIQVCASRDIALRWLAQKVDLVSWQTFYDSLAPIDRGEMTRDMSGMSDEQILDAWSGRDSPSVDEWGNDMYSMTIEQQEVLA